MTSRSDATKEQIINLTHLIVLFQSSSLQKHFSHSKFINISFHTVIIACNHYLAPFLPIENILIAQNFAHLCLTSPYLHFWEIVCHLLWELLSEPPSQLCSLIIKYCSIMIRLKSCPHSGDRGVDYVPLKTVDWDTFAP